MNTPAYQEISQLTYQLQSATWGLNQPRFSSSSVFALQHPKQKDQPGSKPPKANAGFIIIALIVGLVCLWHGVTLMMQGGREIVDATQHQLGGAVRTTGTTFSTANPTGPVAAQKFDETASRVASTAAIDATFSAEDFSMRYPASWQKIPLPVTKAGKIFEIRTLSGAINALITREPVPDATTTDICADSVVTATKKVLTNYELVSRSPIQLKPFKGIKLVIKGNISPPKGQSIRCQQDIVIFITNKKAYCVAFTSWDRWVEEFQPVFKHMLDSIDAPK